LPSLIRLERPQSSQLALHFLAGVHTRDSSQNVSGAALRGRGAERAHRIRNTLNGPVADANFVGDFQNAFASSQMIADALFNGCADARPTEHFASFHGSLEPGMDALATSRRSIREPDCSKYCGWVARGFGREQADKRRNRCPL
jgi:hypothetical protein